MKQPETNPLPPDIEPPLPHPPDPLPEPPPTDPFPPAPEPPEPTPAPGPPEPLPVPPGTLPSVVPPIIVSRTVWSDRRTRPRGEPLRGSQPNRAARGAAFRFVGDEESLGASGDL